MSLPGRFASRFAQIGLVNVISALVHYLSGGISTGPQILNAIYDAYGTAPEVVPDEDDFELDSADFANPHPVSESAHMGY